MSIYVLTEFKTKPGKAAALKNLLRELLPRSLEHGGAEEICVRQNQDDPNDIVSAQRWVSREVYLDYRGWRSDNGTTARIPEMLSAPISVRRFDDGAMGRHDEAEQVSRPRKSMGLKALAGIRCFDAVLFGVPRSGTRRLSRSGLRIPCVLPHDATNAGAER